jgi:hypothetical protein
MGFNLRKKHAVFQHHFEQIKRQTCLSSSFFILQNHSKTPAKNACLGQAFAMHLHRICGVASGC